MPKLFSIAAVAGLAGISGQSYAAYSWNFSTSGTCGGGSGCTTRTYAPLDNPSVIVGGYSNTASSSLSGTASNSTNTHLETAWIGSYGGNGLGIHNRDGSSSTNTTGSTKYDTGDLASTAPEHAMDNEQRQDMMLFSFSEAISLTSARIGWDTTDGSAGYDADITVLAYTGVGAPTLGLYTNLIGNGWTLIGHYGNLDQQPGDTQAISTSVTSSYWLVGSYMFGLTGDTGTNPDGAACTASSTYSYCKKDYLKLLALTGDKPPSGGGGPVPEPGSLALLSIGCLALTAVRRRRTK